jgi:hypothetical protein
MTTLGIDLSSMPPGTAACRIDWEDDFGGKVCEPASECDDPKLDRLISECGEGAVIGIDAPFGWPDAFVKAVAAWTHGQWGEQLRDELRFRETDRVVHKFFNAQKPSLYLRPLSVSTDQISLPAMRAMALLKRHGVTDRSGDGRFFEVYPAGSLATWGLRHKGYKQGDHAAGKRGGILNALRAKFPVLTIPSSYAETDHALDALIAAITARLAALGLTQRPSQGQQSAAKTEGWIHLPLS